MGGSALSSNMSAAMGQSLPASISAMASSMLPNSISAPIPAVSVMTAGGNSNSQSVLGSGLNQSAVVVPVNAGGNTNVGAVSTGGQSAHMNPIQQAMGAGQLPGSLTAPHLIPPMMSASMNMPFGGGSMPLHLLSMPSMPILNVTNVGNVGQGAQGGQAPMSALRMVGSNMPAMNNGMIPHMGQHMHSTIMLSGAGMNQQGTQDSQDIPNIQGE